MKKISYTKQMRDRAKVDGKHLVTVDVPGFTFQGPCSKAEAKEALEMVTRWLKAEAELAICEFDREPDDIEAACTNAQLIAKAPELLARCRELIDILWQYEWSVVHPLQPKLIELLDATRKTVQEVKSDRT